MSCPAHFATPSASSARPTAKAVTFAALIACVLLGRAAAGEFHLRLIDRHGEPVEDAVITLMSAEHPRPGLVDARAIMDQRNRAFVPGVIVVATGTTVEFPNNDSVSHQVYSFSEAKKFQLPLYKGAPHPPVKFDREGLVVLGCNIHDSMVGYIYVTAASFFAKTGANGESTFSNVPTGDYRLVVWGPYIADPDSALTRTIHVTGEVTSERLQLTRELRVRPEPRPGRSGWDY
jgi:plastocyanin